MEMSSRIPDRWIKYAALGRRIANTPFVAFKCPLKKELSVSLPPDDQFGLEELRTALPHLSLIVDLTNTKRYYNPRVLKEYGIEHEKILTPGHVIPPKDRFHQFFRIVDNFIQNNGADSDKLIGVHCTHGLNRTGLFVCSYMICKLGYKYENAVAEFNAARGHTIERENYLNELKKFETRPLNFDSVTYARTKQEPRLRRPVEQPLMRVPPPLMPPHLIPHPARIPPRRERDQRYQPPMYPPRPLMEPTSSFSYSRDRRPYRDFSDRRPPPRGRQPYPAFHHGRSRKAKPLDWNWRRPRVFRTFTAPASKNLKKRNRFVYWKSDDHFLRV